MSDGNLFQNDLRFWSAGFCPGNRRDQFVGLIEQQRQSGFQNQVGIVRSAFRTAYSAFPISNDHRIAFGVRELDLMMEESEIIEPPEAVVGFVSKGPSL